VCGWHDLVGVLFIGRLVWADGVFFSVMNFVGYQYQKERERELMGEWLEVGDGGTGDLEER